MPIPQPEEHTWAPILVDLECQGYGRVAACDFVRAALGKIEVVAVVPRSGAEVVLYLDVTQRQNDDLWLLRAVSELEGAPAAYEQIATVDSRANVDDQVAAFDQPLGRVLAPFVAARIPDAVTVELAAPEDGEAADRKTTPYGAAVWGGGWGSWTAQYQSLSAWSGVSVDRTTTHDNAGLWINYDRDIERQPALRVKGRRVPLVYDSESVDGGLSRSVNLDDHWAIGLVGRGGHEDRDGQYLATARLHAGVERNWFPSDDPRGNRLAVAYLIGGQYDVYQRVNVLGEREAVFPTHLVLVQGEVKFDTTELNLDLAAQAELLRPDRRYVLSIDGGARFDVGDHIDLALNVGVTQQAIPGPATIDQSDFEQVKRASYAQPLEMTGNLTFRLHFDATNGARNNRFEGPSELSPTDNL